MLYKSISKIIQKNEKKHCQFQKRLYFCTRKAKQ